MSAPPQRELLIARPRGFCAGVDRAIAVVNLLLEQNGAPLHVRREIVHNKSVVEDFRARGVVFVDELGEVPDGQVVVFSAHGVSPAVREDADRRGLRVVDATCPLVTKVHQEIVKHAAEGYRLILIGHAGHDEVLGTMGEAPDRITLVTSVADVAALDFPAGTPLAYATQTTLSVDETHDIVAALKARYPDLHEPRRSDICYATQNRQDAVKALVQAGVQHLLVVGSRTSSNSRRLCEVAENLGASASLIDSSEDIDPGRLSSVAVLGLTAGASAPEHLVQNVVVHLRREGWNPRELVTLEENVAFSLPSELIG
ncbi:4-hydroxy-3-methylbut-2-enyl diphosphate reductase [bacterium CG17_big_fil_post_rev_8_21_14_2_50_64_8]|nr:MAG: 4-hydroxy-3-methylbut-2-enyl diphosphate reductase [bacterium CG17_big_fil_post_rev_8_21_14_2_50_64_8]PJA76307.1 MAG: 4-hydroxy-3-methylbut-2-enyl diphosphate reductase [bacterium CG_4_9_14_3_um_filter_65_15]